MKRFTLAAVLFLMVVCAGVFAMPEPEQNISTTQEVACHGLGFGSGNGLFGIRGRVRGRIQARQAARAARWAAR